MLTVIGCPYWSRAETAHSVSTPELTASLLQEKRLGVRNQWEEDGKENERNLLPAYLSGWAPVYFPK